jgi:tetratricopeptide (TPR) repeat protein
VQLSVCVIAKNEQARLGRALGSVASIADEIVVADTGSTDDTVGVALKHGARVVQFPWVDDFSAAYNFSIDQARGRWILLLDADEKLLESSQAAMLGAISRDDTLAYSVMRRDLVDESRPDFYSKMLHLRIFRNRPDLRFIGRIHHQFIEPLSAIAAREQLQVLPAPVELVHYGYVGNQKEAKLHRAAHLMELELQDRPGQFYFLVELGRTWLALHDARGEALLTEAAQMVKDRRPEALEPGGMLAALLEHVLATDILPSGFPLTRELASELAVRHFPNSIPLIWQRALHDFKQGRFAACARLLESVVHLAKIDAYDMRSSFDPQIMGERAVLNLGVCYVRLGRIDDAQIHFRQLLDSSQFQQQAQSNLNAIAQLKRAK